MTPFFTPESANHALVFVRPIVEDIQALWKTMQDTRKSDALNKEALLRGKLERMEHYLEELAQVGCECRDLERGLIDFPTVCNGEAAYLCWEAAEARVSHWHGVHEGYASRQTINEAICTFSTETASPATSIH